jgi:hypothetical protein
MVSASSKVLLANAKRGKGNGETNRDQHICSFIRCNRHTHARLDYARSLLHHRCPTCADATAAPTSTSCGRAPTIIHMSDCPRARVNMVTRSVAQGKSKSNHQPPTRGRQLVSRHRTTMPAALSARLTSCTGTSRRWKIPAASAASTFVLLNTSTKCWADPAPADGVRRAGASG